MMTKRTKDDKAPHDTRAEARPRTPERKRRGGKKAAGTQPESDWNAQLTEDRVGRVDTEGAVSQPVGAMSSANSISADPFARNKALGEPVPQVTRHI
jgi:hypothetical protein